MNNNEFEAWARYYRAHPFDDLHRYHRPAALLAASKGYRLDDALGYLHPSPAPEGIDEIGMSVIRALGVVRP